MAITAIDSQRNLDAVSGTLVAAMLAIELGGIFGNASVDGTRLDANRISLEITVEVEDEPAAVVAHLLAPSEPQITVSLASDDGKVFRGFTDIRPVDMVVIFEALMADGAVESQPLRLTELGIDPAVLGIIPNELSDDVGTGGEDRSWLIALALTAAALSLGVIWLWMGMKGKESTEQTTSANAADQTELPLPEQETLPEP